VTRADSSGEVPANAHRPGCTNASRVEAEVPVLFS
jgi:hypothetical protein